MLIALAALFSVLLEHAVALSTAKGDEFVFNGFSNANLSLGGSAMVSHSGLLTLSNTTRYQKAHAFLESPLRFRRPTGSQHFSFSTTFVFAIVPKFPLVASHGMAFVISPTKKLPDSSPGQYLGLFSPKNDGNKTNHILAVEFDVLKNPQFEDIDDNHVGIDANSIVSLKSATARYAGNGSRAFENLTLAAGDPLQAWVEFDGRSSQVNVTVSPFRTPKPRVPLLSAIIPSVFLDSMYVGFSSATGRQPTNYYVLGWSFKVNGNAQALNSTSLPELPREDIVGSKKPLSKVIWLSVAVAILLFVMAVASAVGVVVFRKIKFAEVLEDWELEYGPHRFSYKDLFVTTKGFADKQLLGSGGFGKVYEGQLPSSKIPVAVKRVSHDSRQGMKEFIAEVVSIGRLRHRNLVQLLGYCRRKGELLLVYDLMPNGSLDKFLFSQRDGNITLDWNHRYYIIKGVASGLLYLHEEWEQVVIHRDIKASNVLLDSEFNGRLGDFGLARLYDHGEVLQTTHVVGTMGYIAPELTRTGKATKATDIFAFGAFLLEVACGRKPIERQGLGENTLLVDWVLEKWRAGALADAADPRFKNGEYKIEEVILVLTLGLHCSNPVPTARPTIRQVIQILEGETHLPPLPEDYMNATFPEWQRRLPEIPDNETSNPTFSVSESLINVGR